MRVNCGLFISILVLIVFQFGDTYGQNKELKYGKTPDKLFPYQNFQEAYKYHFVEPVQFYGAGREKAEPTDIEEVRIGFLGPLEGSPLVPLGEQMLNGATLAMEEANARGGYKDLPYTLMTHNDVGLWGAAANEVVKMDEEGVWAWLGSIDDIVSHVALRATLKMEIMMVNTGDPDPTFTETNIPWAIRVISDDRQSGYALATHIFEEKNHERVAVIRANSRYGRVGIMEYSGAAVRLGHPMMIEERFNEGETDFSMQLENIKRVTPDAILIWANAKESALVLKQIREMGMQQPVYASDRAVSNEFLSIAGEFAEGIVSTSPYNPNADSKKLKTFQLAYKKRFNLEADVYAAHAYDGMNLILAAIEKVGLNRVLIRDVLTDLHSFQNYSGVTGEIVFDESWNDIGEIWMAEVKNGKFVFSPSPELGERAHSGKMVGY
ncbi:ABC transporter substrate-binding protein [Lutimonas halocynthiae]|uniref:ABC transporter substrate-binding protein n=1 Tax=Lutimonas halocynthiae TaxID=1446477 RepID=UPI0025B321B3|nr:ABC transporter substrate-binding protein [Lutimonas halocynthiae]MDN3642063.1 ABC transporter substrate-binding protein [Lutimonas halocynthiae]